jgi:hypothetical protein
VDNETITLQTGDFIAKGVWIWHGTKTVAIADSPVIAMQIASDLNIVPLLVAALKEALFEAEISTLLWHQSRGFVGTVEDAYDKGLMPPAFVRARAALAAVGREGEERK